MTMLEIWVGLYSSWGCIVSNSVFEECFISFLMRWGSIQERGYIQADTVFNFLSFNLDKEKITGTNVEPQGQRTNWCHGGFDYLQIDQKTMANYSDISSKQNRFCGEDIPSPYVSDTNVLIIQMRTNSDDIRGKGFQLRWEAVSGEF